VTEARGHAQGAYDTGNAISISAARYKKTYNISADTLLINCEGLHGELHSVEAGGLPDKVGREVVGTVRWYTFGSPQFKADLVRHV
jgi:hypothetical protein